MKDFGYAPQKALADHARKTWRAIGIVALGVAVFLLVLNAPNDMTEADPQGALLSAHALITTGHLALDEYPELAPADNYKFREIDGHVYYALSFGTSVLCVPIVWFADIVGYDVLNPSVESRMQRILAALVVALVFILSLRIFRVRMGFVVATFLALIYTLGTSLTSTLGTALWNTGFESVALLGAVLLIVRHRMDGRDLQPFLLGTLVGLAYFCRPSAMWPAALMILYVFLFARGSLLRVALGAVVWLGLLVLISKREFGEWLPAYYQAVIQEQQWDPLLVLRGLTISPGRGVFVFSPFLILILVWMVARFSRLGRNPLFWGSFFGFVFHVLFMVRHVHWWGGACFGARLLTDSVVALAPALMLIADDWTRLSDRFLRGLLAALFLVLGLGSIWIHVSQGLYNPHTVTWNWRPLIDTDPQWTLFNWQYPQFLATEEALDARMLAWGLQTKAPIERGALIGPHHPDLFFIDWNRAAERKNEGDHFRWTKDESSSIGLRLPALEGDAKLILMMGSYEPQTVRVLLNREFIGEFKVDRPHPQRQELVLPAWLLNTPAFRPDGHLLTFEVSDPSDPADDPRRVGAVLWEIGWE